MPSKNVRRRNMEAAVRVLLHGMGLDLTEHGLSDTPRRVVDYLEEFCQPFDPKAILGDGFENVEESGLVVQSNIPFRMCCEHHLLPAIGRAFVGYIPNNRVVGLSKITRLVQKAGTARPSIQERICEQVASSLYAGLEAKGVIVVIKAEHTCMTCRGVNSPGVITTTSSVKGIFRDVPPARAEFFSIIS